MQNQPYVDPSKRSAPHWLQMCKRVFVTHRTLCILVAFVILLVGAVVSGRIFKHNHLTSKTDIATHNNSLTLYYRDGKTVLWQSQANTDWAKTPPAGFSGVVIEDLLRMFGQSALAKNSWQVTTTLDKSLQTTAEQQLTKAEPQLAKQRTAHGVLIGQDVTNGQVVSWVGDATAAQPAEVGLLATPLVYGAIMENDPTITGNTQVRDIREPLPGYPCTNPARPSEGGNCLFDYDYRYEGLISLKHALASGRRVAAVSTSLPLLNQGESSKLQIFANSLTKDGKFACYIAGSNTYESTEEAPCFTAAILGDGLFAKPKDIMQAYATLANNGKKTGQTTFTTIRINGKEEYSWSPAASQVMSARTAGVLTDILSDPAASYLPPSYRGSYAVSTTPVANVFSTNEEATVGSTVQYTSKYAVGVWTFGAPSINGSSELLLQPIASEWMKATAQ